MKQLLLPLCVILLTACTPAPIDQSDSMAYWASSNNAMTEMGDTFTRVCTSVTASTTNVLVILQEGEELTQEIEDISLGFIADKFLDGTERFPLVSTLQIVDSEGYVLKSYTHYYDEKGKDVIAKVFIPKDANLDLTKYVKEIK